MLIFCIVWHLGGSGRVQNTPTGWGHNLLTCLEHFRKILKQMISMDTWTYGHRIQTNRFALEVDIEFKI